MRLLPSLLALGCALAAGALSAQPLPSVPNGTFNRLNDAGAVAWWSPYGWGAPRPSAPLIPEKIDGVSALKIETVNGKGAAGIASPGISAANLRDGFRLTFDLRVSSDYQGNTPWVFLYWTADDKTVTGRRTDIRPLELTDTDRWLTLSHDLPPSSVPPEADRVSINFASNARTGASGATGWLGVANVKIEPLGGSGR